jgi:hypothetical protein
MKSSAISRFTSFWNKGDPLFSIEESAKARKSAQKMNLWALAFVWTAIAASAISFLVYFYVARKEVEAVHEAAFSGIGIIIGLVSVAFLLAFCPKSYTHVFYDRYLRYNRSFFSSRGNFNRQWRYHWINVDQIERIALAPVSSGRENFMMVQIIFKPRFLSVLGRPWPVRFGITEPEDIENLKIWAGSRYIPILSAPPES